MKDHPTLMHRLGDTAWRALLIGAVIVIALWALAYLKVVTIPVILAVFLTALLMPVANRLRKAGLGRGSSTAITTVGGVVVLAGVLTLVVQPAVSGVSGMVDSLERAPASLRDTFSTLGFDPGLLDTIIDSASSEIMTAVQANQQQLVTGVWTAGAAALDVLIGLVLVVVLTIYFVHSGDKLMEWIGTLMPKTSRPGMHATAATAYRVVGSYIRGVAGVGFIDALGIGIALLILIDPGLALPLIVLTFLGAFVPIIGAFITGLLATLVALVTEGLVTALIVLGVVLLVQQLESNVFAPRIYGKVLELPSPVVLVSVAAGAVIGNVLGMFLATPVAAVVAALLRDRPFAVAEHQAGADADAESEAADRSEAKSAAAPSGGATAAPGGATED